MRRRRRRSGVIRSATSPAVAVAVLVAGLVLAALVRVVGGTEQHSWSPGAVAPEFARLTAGKTYQLAVPGGIKDLTDRGIDVTTPRCSYTVRGGTGRPLAVTAEGADTKATNTVGRFAAPVTGEVHVDCLGWGALFVDDADDASPDVAGWLLVLAVVLLTVGAGLGLSALRAGRARRAHTRDTGDEEIERLVRLVHVRSEGGEPELDLGADSGRHRG